MNWLKKTGWFLLSSLPLLLTLLIQVVSVFFIMLYLALFVTTDAYGYFMDNYSYYLLAIQIFTLAVFGLWYFLAYGRKQKLVSPKKLLALPDLGIYILLGMGSYFLISFYMQAASVAVPELIEAYEKMVEESGIGDLTFWSTISTLILAPISEELIFRGITKNLAQKAFRGFWIANIIQALFFGIAHLNWIQGIYAFLLGLLLGYLCEKYHSLYASMLMHLIFNFFGTYLAALLSLLLPSDSYNLLLSIVFLVIGLVLIIPCLIWIHKTKSVPEKPAYWTGEPL